MEPKASAHPHAQRQPNLLGVRVRSSVALVAVGAAAFVAAGPCKGQKSDLEPSPLPPTLLTGAGAVEFVELSTDPPPRPPVIAELMTTLVSLVTDHLISANGRPFVPDTNGKLGQDKQSCMYRLHTLRGGGAILG